MISNKRVSSSSTGHENGLPFFKRFKDMSKNPQSSPSNCDSPISTLPDELLLESFDWVAKTDLIVALRISNVSWHWRAVCSGRPYEFGRLPEHKAATLTNDMLIAIAKRFPNMRAIDLTGCRQITDAGVAALAENCKDLIHVDFRRCTQLTDAAFAQFRALFPYCTIRK